MINHFGVKRFVAAVLAVCSLVGGLILLVPLMERVPPDGAVGNASFSIMQLTDTQYISWKNPSLFYDTTNWIVTNSQKYNLKMVVHTGDLVDTPTHTSEWEVANTAMMTLYDNEISYCWNAGNHDQLPPNETANLWLGDSNSDWLGSQYPAFNQTIMRTKPYWVSDIFNGKNSAVAFDHSGYHFLVINLEFLANSSTLDWMQTILRNNPDANVIVATHDYLNMTDGYGTRSISNSGVLDYTWGNEFKTMLDQYPNVFMTISAHIQSRTTGANNKHVGNREEIFFNRQELNDQLGGASVRIYSFNLTSKQVDVSTFALDLQTWVTDNKNQFSFSTNLQAHEAKEFPTAAMAVGFALVVFGVSIILVRRLKSSKSSKKPK